jgi:hypothetical protein
LTLFAVVVALLLVFLTWYVSPTKPSDKKDLVLALAQILAGTALLSGLYFTWHTLQVNREGQITERFTRAIDQLGAMDDKGNRLLEIRLGGIYALERIARESEEDYWPIMEVLTAYVRQNASLKTEKESTGEESSDEEDRTPDPDIQAIISVLQQRTHSYRHGEDRSLMLQETNLSGVTFMNANLMGAHFLNSNLSGAIFMSADLSDANLLGARLVGALLTGTDLTGTNLSGTDLSGAFLINANLSDANLVEARLVGAILMGTNLSGANLSGALLKGQKMHLQLGRANPREVNLMDARHLTQKQLEDTEGDEHTMLPPGLHPPAHWVMKPSEQNK